MSSVLNSAGLFAVWRRQLTSLLANPLAYIFILAFVVASAAILFLPNAFYTRNICDLGYLLSWDGFPMMAALLAVVVPALTMGAWASERESGTEELLLTMPLSLVDSILGKYFAVMTFVTIALACSLSNVGILAWIGEPDVGLVAANYFGFWLAAAVFVAWSLFASVLVTMPAIAFVFGAAFSGILLTLGWWSGFFDEFNRGVVTVSGVITALTLITLGLSSALLILASRRWRAGHEERTLMQCIAGVLVLVIAVNVWQIGERYSIDTDLSVDGTASLADQSVTILQNLERPVRIAAFISQRLPASAELKAQELEDRLLAIRRFSRGKVTIEIYRPKDALDKDALHARRDYGLKPRTDVVESVVGREQEDVYLSVAVTSGSQTQLIEYVDPGLHVEYELLQAIRTVGNKAKRVIGVVATDLAMGPGVDMRSRSMRPAWQIYNEWAKQYEIREVRLDGPVSDDIEALIVPQPSSLTAAEIQNLHDALWNGLPTLLLEDPLPYFSGPQLAASQPKSAEQNPYGGQEEPEQKGDLAPILRSLGLDFNLNAVLWSDYNPSHAFRGLIPRTMVWTHRHGSGEKSNFADSEITRGFNDLLFPFAGMIKTAEDKPSTITVTSLIGPTPESSWGWHRFSDHVESNPYSGGLNPKEPTRWTPDDTTARVSIAVQVTGTMPSTYPKPDPTVSGDKPGEPRVGIPSPKPVNVVVVADTDVFHDSFFQFYRDVGQRISGQQETAFLRDLRNVQFATNLVDVLVGQNDLVAIRSRHTPLRKLTFIDEQITQTQIERTQTEDLAKNNADGAIKIAQEELNEKVAAIAKLTDLDAATKSNLAEATGLQQNRLLQVRIDGYNTDREVAIESAKARQRQKIESIRTRVRLSSMIIPLVVLAGIALMVFLRRVIRERTHVPPARSRSTP